FNSLQVSDGLHVWTLGPFFFDATATSELYTLSLHDALPISLLYFDSRTNTGQLHWSLNGPTGNVVNNRGFNGSDAQSIGGNPVRSEERREGKESRSASGRATGSEKGRMPGWGTAQRTSHATP